PCFLLSFPTRRSSDLSFSSSPFFQSRFFQSGHFVPSSMASIADAMTLVRRGKLGKSAALRAPARAAPPKPKIALQKNDFRRFQLDRKSTRLNSSHEWI